MKECCKLTALKIFADLLTPKVWYYLGAEKGVMIRQDKLDHVMKEWEIWDGSRQHSRPSSGAQALAESACPASSGVHGDARKHD